MTAFLAFSGSTRNDSFNHKVAACLTTEMGKLGHSSELISLNDFDMPIYNGDLEAKSGLPAATVSLKQKISNSYFFPCCHYTNSLRNCSSN
jgi:NAD(P)H-dependent FMN reductase